MVEVLCGFDGDCFDFLDLRDEVGDLLGLDSEDGAHVEVEAPGRAVRDDLLD